MKLELEQISDSITHHCDGFWYSTIESEQISYTKNGHNNILAHEIDSFWFYYRKKIILTVIRKYDFEWLLDVGGGNGDILKFLEKNLISGILLEPNVKAIYNALNNDLPYLIKSSLFTSGIKDSVVPAVSLFDVLEHVENDKLFLEEVHKILKPDGFIILTVPAYNFLWSYNDVKVGHFRRYTLKSLSKLLQHAGFEISYKTYFFSLLPIPIFIIRNLFCLFNMNKERNRYKVEHQKRSSIIGHLYRFPFLIEQKLIKHNKKILCGSSCLIVAKKHNNLENE